MDIKKTGVILILIGLSLLTGCNEKKTENWTALYDGKGMDAWSIYLTAHWTYFEENNIIIGDDVIDKSLHLGWDNDPYGVFTEVEEAGEKMIRISGEVYGAMVSKEEYENYHLRLVFKWGTKKWFPRLNDNLDSGILYHSVGSVGIGHNSWMRSNEFQIEEGHCGDFYTVAGIMNTAKAIPDTVTRFYIYDNAGEQVTFAGNNWLCKGNSNNEKPNGEWNTLDLYTYGGKSVHVVNGKRILMLLDSRQISDEGIEVPVTSGKIQIQSEAAELFVKYVGIRNITKLPAEL
jgi:hypothetical protein